MKIDKPKKNEHWHVNITMLTGKDNNKIIKVLEDKVLSVQNWRCHKYKCDDLCFRSKNLYNQGLFNIRQHYFKKEEYLDYVRKSHHIQTRELQSFMIGM